MSFTDTVKRFGNGIIGFFKKAFAPTGGFTWLICLVIGLSLNFVIECLHRHSVIDGFLHVFQSPLPFLFNSLIITTIMALCSLSKRKLFFYFLVGAVFLGFGIANCVLLSLRVNPLEGADLQIVKISLITKYLSTFEIILIIAAIALALAALGVMFFKLPKKKINYPKEIVSFLIYAVILTVSLVSFRSSGILLNGHSKYIATAYKNYGFNYCFLCSIFDVGIDKPAVYDEPELNNIISEIHNSADNNTFVKDQAELIQNGENQPNVIFLQLETFFDVNHLSNVKFSEDPIPNFTKLHNSYSSGYISVPSIGGGTANTEFEVITGMSLNDFGMGEYPYKTVLQSNPCESVCFNLKNHGYNAHAIHNNTAIFYDRDKVFSNLGFDTFTALEHMQDVEYTKGGWAKDNVLLGCINDCLDSTEGSDVVYTITVQSHGKYPSEYDDDMPITVENFSEDEDTNSEFKYYINQLHEVDQFIGQLLQSLQTRGERTVVVMYGDHLPSFEIEADDLEGGDLFQTEYVIWDNFGLEKIDGNIAAYQLSAHVLGLLGHNDGMLTKLHQNHSEQDYYLDWLRTLEYDMLYGKKYAFGGKENYPYKTTDLKLGVKDISLTDVLVNEDGTLTVTGKWFTERSRIKVNDSVVDTLFVDNFTLMTESDIDLGTGDRITVAQTADGGKQLNDSNYYLVGGTEDTPTESIPSEPDSSESTSSELSSDTASSDGLPSDGAEDEDEIVYETVGFKLSTSIAIIIAGLAVIIASTAVVFIMKHRKTGEK